MIGNVGKDLRFALRQILARPGLSAVIVISLALAIAANAAIFALVNAVVLGSVEAREPERLVAIYTMDQKNPGHLPVSDQNGFDIREQAAGTLDVALFGFFPAELDDGEGAGGFNPGLLVSGDYFEVLGIEPAHGRLFDHGDAELGAHPQIVISHDLWQQRYGGDPSVVGRTVAVNGAPVTVIGVTPEEFYGTTAIRPAVFAPYSAHREVMPEAPFFDNRRFLAFFPIARMADGVTIEQANAELQRIGAHLASTYPDVNTGRSFRAVTINQALIGPDQHNVVLGASALMMTIVGFILVIACANAANLLLARAASRRSEIAVRQVLGASPGRIVRQLLTESLVLAGLAAVLGVALASPLANVLWGLRPPQLAFGGLQPELDLRVLAFATALAVLAGLAFGLAPALRSSRVDLITPLKEETTPTTAFGRRLNLRSGLVILQVALSAVALIGAGLFLRSMDNARAVDPGFEDEQLLLVDVTLKVAGDTPAVQTQARTEAVAEIVALPEVATAVAATHAPFGQGGLQRTVYADGRQSGEEDGILHNVNHVGPGYFAAIGQPLIEGRGFEPTDDLGRDQVAVVNEVFARRYWPSQSPIGQRIRFMGVEQPVEIVGVVATVNYQTLTEDPLAVIYLPLAQWEQPAFTLHVRTPDPEAAGPVVEAALHGLGSEVDVNNVRTIRQQMDGVLFGPRVAAILLGSLGVLALVLAMIGLYGVMIFSVRQRTRELGIRMALGARPRDVRRFVVLEAMTLVAYGLGLGAIAALGLQSLLEPLLFQVPWGDPGAFVGATALLTGLALVAAYLPALHATRISPHEAMHHD